MKPMLLYTRPSSCVHPVDHFNLFDAFTAFDANPLQQLIQRYPNEYKLDLQIPGMKKKDLNIRVEGDALIIEGKQKEESKNSYYTSSFMKRVHLGEDMDPEGIKAKHKNGVLSVHIPRKKESVTYREIPVSGSDPVENAVMVEEPRDNWLNLTLNKVQNWFRKSA